MLQDGGEAAHGTVAVIAPGTGLGEATLVHDGTLSRAALRGGHADFAPSTEEEIQLLRYLRSSYGDHVSYERVLAGNGIGDLYGFAPGARHARARVARVELATGDCNAVVAKAALAKRDPRACARSSCSSQVLGAEAGNQALRGSPREAWWSAAAFRQDFARAADRRVPRAVRAKGRFAAWTRQLDVCVALEPRAAFLGAAHHAAPEGGCTA